MDDYEPACFASHRNSPGKLARLVAGEHASARLQPQQARLICLALGSSATGAAACAADSISLGPVFPQPGLQSPDASPPPATSSASTPDAPLLPASQQTPLHLAPPPRHQMRHHRRQPPPRPALANPAIKNRNSRILSARACSLCVCAMVYGYQSWWAWHVLLPPSVIARSGLCSPVRLADWLVVREILFAWFDEQ